MRFWKIWDITLIVLGVIWGLGLVAPQIIGFIIILLVWFIPYLAFVIIALLIGALFFIPARLFERFVLRRFIRRRLCSFLASVVLLLGIWNLYAFVDLTIQNRRVAALLAGDTGPIRVAVPPDSTLAILGHPSGCEFECRLLLLKGSVMRVLVTNVLPFDASPDLQQPATAWYFENRATCPEPGEVRLGGPVKGAPSRLAHTSHQEHARAWQVNYQLRRLAVEGRCLVSAPAELGQAELILSLSENTGRRHGGWIWGELIHWARNRSQAVRYQLWQTVDGAAREVYRDTLVGVSRFSWRYGRTLILPFPLTENVTVPDSSLYHGLEEPLKRALGLDLTLDPAPPYEEFAAFANRMLNSEGEISPVQDLVVQDWVRAMSEHSRDRQTVDPAAARAERALYLRIVQDLRFSMPSLPHGLSGTWTFHDTEWEVALLAATLERAEDPEIHGVSWNAINEAILSVSPDVLVPQRERVLRWAAYRGSYGAREIRERVLAIEREAGGAGAADTSLCGLAPPGVPCYPLAD